MWFRVEADALDDERIVLLAQELGVSHGDAFHACSRVWCWLYKRGAGVMRPEEIDAVARHSGFANAMLNACLAEATEHGLRVKGGKRAEAYASFRERQKAKSELAVIARTSGKNVAEHTFAHPPGNPSPLGDPDIYLRSGSGSSGDPDSGKSTRLAKARERMAEKRERERAAVESFLEWFNRTFGKAFRGSQEVTKLIGALLDRGYSEKPDMRGVALYLESRWKDDERMRDFLVPSTILRATKFQERLDLAKQWAPDIWGGGSP